MEESQGDLEGDLRELGCWGPFVEPDRARADHCREESQHENNQD